MVDMHTHILPRLDDGAKDSSTSMAMLRLSKAQGVDTVVLTPHFYGKRHNPAEFLLRRNASYQRLLARMQETQTQINVRLGAEVHFTGINLPDFDDLCSLAIEGTKYILFELPFTTKWAGTIEEKLQEFINETEYTPIIAHVERYAEIRKNPSIVARLIHMGCLIQVNAQAFVNRKDKGFAFALLKKNSVHCIGSDAHDETGRAPNLLEAKNAIEKAGFLEKWKDVQDVMKNVLQDEKVQTQSVVPVKKLFGFYR